MCVQIHRTGTDIGRLVSFWLTFIRAQQQHPAPVHGPALLKQAEQHQQASEKTWRENEFAVTSCG